MFLFVLIAKIRLVNFFVLYFYGCFMIHTYVIFRALGSKKEIQNLKTVGTVKTILAFCSHVDIVLLEFILRCR